MTVSLYDPFAGIGPQNPFSGVAATQGNLFHVAADCNATAIGIFTNGSTPNNGIDVGIYDLTDSAWVVSFTSPTWTLTAQGWALSLIEPGEPLLASHSYGVYAWYPSGVGWYYDCNVPAPGPGLFWDKSPQNGAVEEASSDLSHPTTGVSNRTHPVSVSTDLNGSWPSPPGSTSGASAQDVSDEIARWESSDSGVNTHESDGLPWLTKAQVDANADTLVSIEGKVDAQGATLDVVAGDVADLHAKVSNDGVTLDAKIGPLQLYGGVTSEGVSAGVEIVRQQVGDANAKLDALTGTSFPTLREQLTLSPTLEEGARWHLVNTVTGEARGLVGEQADLYIVAITAVGEDINQETVEGQPWFPRWGWLAPRVHGAFRQRQFHDLSPFAVTADGLLMDGLLVAALPSVGWSVDAWVLDRA